MSMTKKEIDALLGEVKSLAKKAESTLSRNDKKRRAEKSTNSD